MSAHIFLGRTDRSYIDVILKDGTYHHFTPRVLSVLLETRRVHKFKRSSGWATVGIDPIRIPKKESLNQHYNGQNRRELSL